MTDVTFVGSYPTPDFQTSPALPEIAFLGRSNVGKSSLINALVGRRSIARTSQEPGKTQYLNVFNVQGRFYLVDLPGYGYAKTSHKERERFLQLIQGYVHTRASLAGAVWLVDIRRTPSADDLEMAHRLADRAIPVLVAVTKADKVKRGGRQERINEILRDLSVPDDQYALTSAKTKEGIEDLRDAVDRFVEAFADS